MELFTFYSFDLNGIQQYPSDFLIILLCSTWWVGLWFDRFDTFRSLQSEICFIDSLWICEIFRAACTWLLDLQSWLKILKFNVTNLQAVGQFNEQQSEHTTNLVANIVLAHCSTIRHSRIHLITRISLSFSLERKKESLLHRRVSLPLNVSYSALKVCVKESVVQTVGESHWTSTIVT